MGILKSEIQNTKSHDISGSIQSHTEGRCAQFSFNTVRMDITKYCQQTTLYTGESIVLNRVRAHELD